MPINLLSALSDADIGDLGIAASQDPSLLRAPEKGWAGQLADQANSVTRFFGHLFNDESAIQIADLRDRRMEVEEQQAIQERIIPIIGASRQRRLEEAHAEKIAQQEFMNEQRAQAAQDRALVMQERVANNYAIRGKDGKLRDVSPDEMPRVMAALEAGLNDPSGALLDGRHDNLLPEGLERYGPAQRQADREAMQDDRQLEAEKRAEASAKRQDAYRAGLAEKAQEKADAARLKLEEDRKAAMHKEQVSAYRAEARQLSTLAASEKNLEGSEKVRHASDVRVNFAKDAANRILTNPTAWENVNLLEAIYSDLSKEAGYGFVQSMADNALDMYGSPDRMPKPIHDFLVSHPIPKKK